MIHLTLHQLSAHLDGELAEASTELVRRHLSQCSECTERFALIEAQEEILECLLNHDPGEAFFDYFVDNFDFSSRKSAPRRWPRPAATPIDARDPEGEGVSPTESAESPFAASATPIEHDPARLIPNQATPVGEPSPPPPSMSESEPVSVEHRNPAPIQAPIAVQVPAPRPVSVAAPVPVAPRVAESGRPASPTLYGRRAEDRKPPARWPMAAGWIVAGIVGVIALSVAFVGTRQRVAPLPIPTVATPPPPEVVSDAPAEQVATVSQPEEAIATAPADTLVPPVEVAAVVDAAADPEPAAPSAPTVETRPKVEPSKSVEPPPAREPARRAPIEPPPAPRPPRHMVPVRTIITKTTTAPEPSAPTPTPSAPSSSERDRLPSPSAATVAREMAHAKDLSLVAARTMTAPAFESAAEAWETLLPRLSESPESEAIARREIAQARFQAWAVEGTPGRRELAITAARAYLLYAPPGPDRDQGWTWLGRLKR